MANQIVDKSLFFGKKSINFYFSLKSTGHYRLADQFVKSATSIGAKVEVASAAHSKLDFVTTHTTYIRN
jgi:four helix bundle protein